MLSMEKRKRMRKNRTFFGVFMLAVSITACGGAARGTSDDAVKDSLSAESAYRELASTIILGAMDKASAAESLSELEGIDESLNLRLVDFFVEYDYEIAVDSGFQTTLDSCVHEFKQLVEKRKVELQ